MPPGGAQVQARPPAPSGRGPRPPGAGPGSRGESGPPTCAGAGDEGMRLPASPPGGGDGKSVTSGADVPFPRSAPAGSGCRGAGPSCPRTGGAWVRSGEGRTPARGGCERAWIHTGRPLPGASAPWPALTAVGPHPPRSSPLRGPPPAPPSSAPSAGRGPRSPAVRARAVLAPRSSHGRSRALCRTGPSRTRVPEPRGVRRRGGRGPARGPPTLLSPSITGASPGTRSCAPRRARPPPGRTRRASAR